MNVSNELMMPQNYVELSEDEMEYDGGLINFLAGIALTAGSMIATYAGNAGIIDKDLANKISIGCTIGSFVLTGGTIALTSKAAMAAGKTITVRTLTGKSVVNASDTAANGAISLAVSDPLQYTASWIYSSISR